MADPRLPLPTQRCILRGGSFDGQLRLVAAGPTPTLTVAHELDGRWWAETYAHDGALALSPDFGFVRGLVFRERRLVRNDDSTGDGELP